MRIDTCGGPLRLEDRLGGAETRARAARSVRRLLGVGAGPEVTAPGPVADFEGGFTVSDGRKAWTARMIDNAGSARLLVFAGALPPAGTDLWVVRAPACSPAATAPGGVICFTPGTAIRTACGAVPVETLRPGDRVQTRDDGEQEVLWAACSHLSGARLHVAPALRPIRFRAGALGIGRPERDLLVSPGHRMLVKGAHAAALYNTPEVLVAACDLIDGQAVAIDHLLREVTYVHLLFARHQIVWANGLETESFDPGAAALEALAAPARTALLALVPDLAADAAAYGGPARRCLTAAEAAILRHGRAA